MVDFQDNQLQKSLVEHIKPGMSFEQILKKERSDDLNLTLFCNDAQNMNPKMIENS